MLSELLLLLLLHVVLLSVLVLKHLLLLTGELLSLWCELAVRHASLLNLGPSADLHGTTLRIEVVLAIRSDHYTLSRRLLDLRLTELSINAERALGGGLSFAVGAAKRGR